MRIWIGNLGKYIEGKLVGKWFELPIENIEEALKSIGVEEGTQYEECHICDQENVPFEVYEYANLNELNRKAKAFKELNEEQRKVLKTLLDNNTYDFDKCIEIIENEQYTIYNDCEDMKDVAFEYVQDHFNLEEMGELANYIDYEMYGDTLDTSGTYYAIDNNTFVEIHR